MKCERLPQRLNAKSYMMTDDVREEEMKRKYCRSGEEK